jgi:hypothetical protein
MDMARFEIPAYKAQLDFLSSYPSRNLPPIEQRQLYDAISRTRQRIDYLQGSKR